MVLKTIRSRQKQKLLPTLPIWLWSLLPDSCSYATRPFCFAGLALWRPSPFEDLDRPATLLRH